MTTWRKVMQSGDGEMMGGGEIPRPPVGRIEELMVIQENDCGDDDGNDDDGSPNGKSCKPRHA
jgi:hypothetical protein